MSLWGEAIKTAMYILNRVPSKFIPLTPFELCVSRKSSLIYFQVWGCLAKVRIYNPSESKLDLKTTRRFFVGYPDNSKGYKFYFHSRSTKIVDSITVKFLENDTSECSCSHVRDVNVEEETTITPIQVV